MGQAWGIERGALWALDLPPAGPPPSARLAVRFAEAGAPDVSALASAMQVAPDVVTSRLARGAVAHVAWHDAELAAYGWVSEGRERVGELARDFVLPGGESYIWDCATVPRFRGRGVYAALVRSIADALAAKGRRRAWIGASTGNRASNRTFAAVGFEPACEVLGVRLAGRGLLLRFGGADGASAELVAAARSVLTGRLRRP